MIFHLHFFFSRDPTYRQDRRKDDDVNQNSPKQCIATETVESSTPSNREFINHSTTKHLASNNQQETSDIETSERNNAVIKTQQPSLSTRQFNQNEPSKTEPIIQVSEVDVSKGHGDQLPNYEVEKGYSIDEPLTVRQRGGSVSNVQHPEEADYEDASDGDNVSETQLQ